MSKAKAAFLYRKTNEDVLREYPEEMRGKVLMWILRYGFTSKTPKDCPPEIAMALRFVFLSIDIEKRRYFNVQKINNIIATLERMAPDLIWPDGAADGKRTIKKEDLNGAIKRLKRLTYRVKKSDVDDINKEILDCMGTKIANAVLSIKKNDGTNPEQLAAMALTERELKAYVQLIQKINNYTAPNQRSLTKYEEQHEKRR